MFERPFWRFFGALGDFCILTAFWLLTSLPFVTVGASTAALFYVFLKKRNGEEGALWQMYKKSFAENAKQGIFLWLLYVFVALDAFLIGYTLCARGAFAASDFARGGHFHVALAVACLLYLSVMLYTAALMATFRQTAGQLVAAAVGMTFGQLPSTLLYLVILGALGYATFYLFPALILIDVPLAVYLISMRMNVIFRKQIERVEKRTKEETEKTGGN